MENESLFDWLHSRIDEEFDSSEPTSDDVKEVYARFGLAYYQAEVLYRGLCNLYCASQVPPTGPVTRYRVEEHLRAAFEMTLGQLLPRLQPILPLTLFEQLEGALERMRIPTKPNAIPERSRTRFRDRSEHLSERSDAGPLILQ